MYVAPKSPNNPFQSCRQYTSTRVYVCIQSISSEITQEVRYCAATSASKIVGYHHFLKEQSQIVYSCVCVVYVLFVRVYGVIEQLRLGYDIC